MSLFSDLLRLQSEMDRVMGAVDSGYAGYRTPTYGYGRHAYHQPHYHVLDMASPQLYLFADSAGPSLSPSPSPAPSSAKPREEDELKRGEEVSTQAGAPGTRRQQQQLQRQPRQDTQLQSRFPYSSLFSDPTSTLLRLPVDITSSDQGLTVKAELPGVGMKDVKLQVKDNVLTMSASKTASYDSTADDRPEAAGAPGREQQPAEGAGAGQAADKTQAVTSSSSSTPRTIHRELSYGSVTRSIRLPKHSDISRITAACKDGMLTVQVPYLKEKAPEVRDIPIQAHI
jgi:HSP20 family molecular chaperone IbpA